MLAPNAFFEARWTYEVLGERQAGLDILMDHFRGKFGKPAFHSYLDRILARDEMSEMLYKDFASAITSMMFRKVPWGSSDFLEVGMTFGVVFEELMHLAFRQNWLHILIEKDFRVPSLSQLWIDPVGESDYGETDSLIHIQATLKEFAEGGWIGMESDPPLIGRIRLSTDVIDSVDPLQWRGLKEWMVNEFPAAIQNVDPTSMWRTLRSTGSQVVLERALDWIWDGTGGVTFRLLQISDSPQYLGMKQVLLDAVEDCSLIEGADLYFLRVARSRFQNGSSRFLRCLHDTFSNNSISEELSMYVSVK